MRRSQLRLQSEKRKWELGRKRRYSKYTSPAFDGCWLTLLGWWSGDGAWSRMPAPHQAGPGLASTSFVSCCVLLFFFFLRENVLWLWCVRVVLCCVVCVFVLCCVRACVFVLCCVFVRSFFSLLAQRQSFTCSCRIHTQVSAEFLTTFISTIRIPRNNYYP